jgi:shikimate kinase
MSPAGEHVVLVGLMGVGKSTVGARLSDVLGWPLVDSDEQVEASSGRTVREIFERDGEAAFRAFEARALAEALDEPGPSIIAAAGGVVLAEENRRRLKAPQVDVVWLRADPTTVTARAAEGVHRPLLADDPAGVLARMAVEREPLYREVADHIVDVDGRSVEDVTTAVLEVIRAC